MKSLPDATPPSKAATPPAEVNRLGNNPILGIGLKVASVAIFVMMSTLIKSTDGIPLGQIIFFRSFFAMVAILCYFSWCGQFSGIFHTRHGVSHFWRGMVGVCAMTMTFLALTLLPLPEAIALNYASPLIAVVLGAVILRETVRFYRWTAVLVGLLGVFIIIWPRLTLLTDGSAGYSEAIGALAALGGATLAAFAMMLVRHLVQTERTPTIVVYFSLSASIISLVSLPFGWVMPSWQQASMLIGAGVAGGVAQILLTECYRHAPMSTIAPFEYTSMLLGLGIGFMLFGDVPTFEMLLGSAIVMAAGGYIIYRERQLSAAQEKAR